MSDERLPADHPFGHPWAGRGWANHVLTGFDSIGQNSIMRSWLNRLSGAMIYVAGAMLAFVIAVDGYVLLRTM